MPLQLLGNELGQGVDAVHTKDQIDVGVALAQLFHHVLLVGHAAAQADDEAVLFLLEALQSAHVAENTLLGVLTDGAGVEEDEVRVLGFIAQAVADVYENALDPLAIVDILLAAIAVHKRQRRCIVALADELRRVAVVFKC